MKLPRDMLHGLASLTRAAALVALLATAPRLTAQSEPQQDVSKSATSSDEAADYFPEYALHGAGRFLSRYFLGPAGEPRLFGVVHDASTLSYRFSWMAGHSGRLLGVRLSFNSDGSAQITNIQGSLPSLESQVHKSQVSVSAAGAEKFLQHVAADFWSMLAVEPENPDGNRRVYVLDGDTWIFEGVRGVSYHVVMRASPEPSSFTEMVRFLAKDLARLDDTWVPQAFPHPLRTK